MDKVEIWVKAGNGGNGVVLDGSERIDSVLKTGLSWDVMGGIARRSWARNKPAIETAEKWNTKHAGEGQITLPYIAENDLVEKFVKDHS